MRHILTWKNSKLKLTCEASKFSVIGKRAIEFLERIPETESPITSQHVMLEHFTLEDPHNIIAVVDLGDEHKAILAKTIDGGSVIDKFLSLTLIQGWYRYGPDEVNTIRSNSLRSLTKYLMITLRSRRVPTLTMTQLNIPRVLIHQLLADGDTHRAVVAMLHAQCKQNKEYHAHMSDDIFQLLIRNLKAYEHNMALACKQFQQALGIKNMILINKSVRKIELEKHHGFQEALAPENFKTQNKKTLRIGQQEYQVLAENFNEMWLSKSDLKKTVIRYRPGELREYEYRIK